MCAIAGMFALDGKLVPADALSRMNAAMIHRGPDDEGVFCDGVAGLAMRRLSIIGLGNGHQPIFNEDGAVAIVMNGEIYNYHELKAELVERGHVFKTSSDVEVAVHLYEERGSDFVRDLRGMFAYALYDRQRRCLLLGRDRFGKKPLYYAIHNGLLVFASEIKALHASGLIPRELDAHAFDSYLAHGFVVGERTLFAGIRKVPAATMLAATAAHVEVQPYWDLPLPAASRDGVPQEPSAFEEAAVRVRMLLEDAVRIRLMSEVPLGAFLSGGVDSSAVVAIMSRQLHAPVETFAVGFDHPEFDELSHAQAAAKLYRSNHHELLIRGCTPALLREINFFNDEPAADPATVPTYCLAKFARERVTVALTGEGGDEIFAGYRHHRFCFQLAELQEQFGGLRAVASLFMHLEPRIGSYGPRKFWKGMWIANLPAAERPRGLVSVFSDAEIERVIAHDFRVSTLNGYHLAEFGRLQQRAHDVDQVAQSMYVDVKSQLAEQLLMKVDKMTMAGSLEARCPFLDQYLVEYVATLPTAMKISRQGSKLLLRRALRGLVPDALLDRPKHGFEVPIRSWLLNDLASLVQELLLAPRAAVLHYLDATAVQNLWKRLHARQDHQLARQLWTLLNFAVWHDLHWPSGTLEAHVAPSVGA